VADPIRFTVSLDDITASRRLRQRRYVLSASAGIAIVGLALWVATRNPLSAVVIALAVLVLLEWRFPIFDRWIDRGRADVGMDCEMWLDESGLAFHQVGEDAAFESTGHVHWSSITTIRQDSRVILIMDGRRVRAGIPKRVFASPGQASDFVSRLSDSVHARDRDSPSSPPKT
jgi:hypothetical protein